MYRVILILLVCLMLPGVATAQDGGELQCGDSDIDATIDSALAQLQAAKSQDVSTALASIVEVRETLAKLDAQCLGLGFEGDKDTVYDPVFIPAGVYRVTLTAASGSIMRLEAVVLDGTCQEYYEAGDDFRLFGVDLDQDASQGIQAVLRSDGCTVSWNTWWVDSAYTVTFEKIA